MIKLFIKYLKLIKIFIIIVRIIYGDDIHMITVIMCKVFLGMI